MDFFDYQLKFFLAVMEFYLNLSLIFNVFVVIIKLGMVFSFQKRCKVFLSNYLKNPIFRDSLESASS